LTLLKESKLSSIFRAAPVGIGMVINRVFQEANDTLCRMTGYSREELLGQNARMLYPTQKDYDFVGQEKYRQIDEKITGTVETRWKRKDGTIIDIILSSTPLDPDNLAKGVTFTALDITERKQAGKALQESEANYRQLFEHSPVGIYQVDFRTGKFLKANDAMCKYLGYSQEEITSLSPYDVLTDESKQLFSERLNKIMLGEDVTEHPEFEIVDRTGKRRWVQLNTKFFSDSDGVAGADVVAHEITDRKCVEEELRVSVEKYRLLAENATDVIWTFSLESMRFTYVSPSIFKARGYTPQEALELTLEQSLSPESFEKTMKTMQEELIRDTQEGVDPKRSKTLEVQQPCKDGTYRWTEVTASFIRNAEGQPVSIIGVTRDITKRKRAEQEMAMLAEIGEVISSTLDIQKVYQKFASITGKLLPFDALTVNLIDVPNNLFCIAYNAGLNLPGRTVGLDIPLTGSMTEYVMHRQKTMIIQADSVEEITRLYPGITRILSIQTGFYSNMLTPLFSNDAIIGVLHFRAKKRNTYSEAEIRLAERIGLQITGAIANSQLFNELSKTEKSLRESEERFRTLVEQAAVGVAEIGMATGSYLTVNRRLCELVDRTEEELLATTFLAITHPEDLHLHEEKAAMMRAEKIGHYSLEKRFVRKDGTIIYANVMVSPLWKPGEKPGRNMIVVQDITDRKRAEEERRILEERLQHADKMEAVGTLAGGIAHDFNNLLMGIQGYASLALMNLDSSHPNYERLKRIEEQVQSGADLTKQLLGFARGGRYDVKPTDMNDILEQSSSMFGRTKKEISIHRKFGKDLRPVEADRGQMEQVFMNLYVNAWQAMPGGGEIYLETEDVVLDDEQAVPFAIKTGRYVKVTVADTGTGMDEKTRARIFDPFFTTKAMGRGTGLGLATVYGIIKGHKGMIAVESEPGHGTTFTIYLPASEKEVMKEKTATGTIARGTETILLVDDEKMVLDVSRELLEFLGYRVYPTGSGQEAIAVYMEKRNKIELVVLDMIMPGISGGETFDRLRGIDPGVKVLLASGYSINGEAKTIMDRGCNGFIQKPFQLEKLSGKIREMLA
jgi:two-component system cell cycle sensor histidine kinase/response regulator CckA